MPQARRKRRSFLLLVDSAEQQVAKLLTVITAVVIVAALIQLTIRVSLALIYTDRNSYWLGDGLIKILGDLSNRPDCPRSPSERHQLPQETCHPD